MELAGKEIVQSLLAGTEPRRRSYPRMTKPRPMDSTYQHPLRGKRCQCAKCAACLDDARWERIFQQKFADPAYYGKQPPRQGSSLGW